MYNLNQSSSKTDLYLSARRTLLSRECLKIENCYDIPSFRPVLLPLKLFRPEYGIVVTASKTTIPYPFAPTSLSDDGILFLKKTLF